MLRYNLRASRAAAATTATPHVVAAVARRWRAGVVSIPDDVGLVQYMEQLGDWEGRQRGKVFMKDALDGRELRFDRVRASATRAARTLRALGTKRVLLFIPNCPEYAVIMLGALSSNVVVSTANPAYTPRELTHQVADSHSDLLLTIPQFREAALEAAANAGLDAARVLCLGDAGTEGFAIVGDDSGEVEPDFAGVEVPDFKRDIAVLPYSSGTTGLPKGVMLSHYNLVANVAQLALDPEHAVRVLVDGTTTMVCTLPLFHIYAMVVAMFLPLAVGAKVVVMPRFDPEVFLRTIEAEKATMVPVVPPIMLFLAKHPLVDDFDLSTLKVIYSAAAPLDPQTQSDVQDRLGVAAVQVYGMTELSPGAICTPGGKLVSSGYTNATDVRHGSVGLPFPNTDCKIVDPATQRELPEGEAGELYIAGPQVMVGYYNRPDATKETMSDCGKYLKTGDIFRKCPDGYYYAVDRLKELIKVKGFQVAPAELEGLIVAHPSVVDAAVVPKDDGEGGEYPLACVVVKEGASVTADEVKEHVAKQAAAYKRLGAVEFVDAIPKSPSGKILRRILRERFA